MGLEPKSPVYSSFLLQPSWGGGEGSVGNGVAPPVGVLPVCAPSQNVLGNREDS